MEKIEQCPVCKQTEFIDLFECKDYVASGESFPIVSCKNCSLQFTSVRPKEEEVGRYYQSNNYISHSGNDKSELGVTYKIYDWVRNFSIGSKLQTIKQFHNSGSLLDLGCGLGYFLNGVTLDQTFDAKGADVSQEAIEYVKNQFAINVLPEGELNTVNDASFDVITQWHVMEHVYRLDERMTLLKRILKPNGTMFIAVPISNSYDAKYYKQFWDGYDVPRHLFHFTPKSFEYLMEKHGFKVVRKKSMLFDAPYISMRSEYHQKHKFGFIKGGIIGIFSIINAWFTGNYSSVMFIVKHK